MLNVWYVIELLLGLMKWVGVLWVLFFFFVGILILIYDLEFCIGIGFLVLFLKDKLIIGVFVLYLLFLVYIKGFRFENWI